MYIWPLVRESWILDSMQWIPDSRYWIPDSLSVELGFWIPIASEIWVPRAEVRIPKPKIPEDSTRNISLILSPQANISQIPESGFPYMALGRCKSPFYVILHVIFFSVFIFCVNPHNQLHQNLSFSGPMPPGGPPRFPPPPPPHWSVPKNWIRARWLFCRSNKKEQLQLR